MTGNDYLSVFSLIGVLIIIRAYLAVQKAKNTQTWEQTTGRLEKIGIHEIKSLDLSYGIPGSKDRHFNWITDHIKAEYTYQVNGKKYKGRRVTMTDNVTKTKPILESILAKYQKEGACTVYYDPAKPESSVLIKGLSGWNAGPFITGGIFLMFPWIYKILAG